MFGFAVFQTCHSTKRVISGFTDGENTGRGPDLQQENTLYGFEQSCDESWSWKDGSLDFKPGPVHIILVIG